MQELGVQGLNTGLLPPFREILLEMQVNKLINEYLFSNNVDETSNHHNDETSMEFKVNTGEIMPPDSSCLTDGMPLNSSNASLHDGRSPQSGSTACEGCTVRSSNVSSMQSQHESQSTACKKDEAISIAEENILSGNAVACNKKGMRIADIACKTSLATISIDNDDSKLLNKTVHLSRVETLPGVINKAHLQPGAACKREGDVTSSFKKPPRPPRLSKSSSKDFGLRFARCASDTQALLLSAKRAKLERKRKIIATTSPSTSMLALFFTLCFAIIMIAQGFWSEGSRALLIYGINAPSPTEAYMKANIPAAPQEVSLVKMEGEQASTKGANGHLSAMRKVLMKSKHLELDTS